MNRNNKNHQAAPQTNTFPYNPTSYNTWMRTVMVTTGLQRHSLIGWEPVSNHFHSGLLQRTTGQQSDWGGTGDRRGVTWGGILSSTANPIHRRPNPPCQSIRPSCSRHVFAGQSEADGRPAWTGPDGAGPGPFVPGP
ncbi:hypothetical protein MHYP_G00282010 [Metynnis hypsauchen]